MKKYDLNILRAQKTSFWVKLVVLTCTYLLCFHDLCWNGSNYNFRYLTHSYLFSSPRKLTLIEDTVKARPRRPPIT